MTKTLFSQPAAPEAAFFMPQGKVNPTMEMEHETEVLAASFDLVARQDEAEKATVLRSDVDEVKALLHATCEGEAGTPPASPVEGEAWIVASGASGDWAGEEGKLAAFQSGTWLFVSPKDGMRLFDRATGQVLLYNGGWQRPATPVEPSGGSTVDAEARAAVSALIAQLVEAGIFPST